MPRFFLLTPPASLSGEAVQDNHQICCTVQGQHSHRAFSLQLDQIVQYVATIAFALPFLVRCGNRGIRGLQRPSPKQVRVPGGAPVF